MNKRTTSASLLKNVAHKFSHFCSGRETKGKLGWSWQHTCTTARSQLGNVHLYTTQEIFQCVCWKMFTWCMKAFCQKRQIKYSAHCISQQTFRARRDLLCRNLLLCPQSRPGAHHRGHEEVLWGQSLFFSTAISEQVTHTTLSSSVLYTVVFLLWSYLPFRRSCCLLTFSSVGTSTTLAVCCPVPSRWTAVLSSFIRSSFPLCQTSRLEEVSFSQAGVRRILKTHVWLTGINKPDTLLSALVQLLVST